MVSWFDLTSSSAPHGCLLTPTPSGVGERMGKKVKPVGWEKQSLIGWKKTGNNNNNDNNISKTICKTNDAQASSLPPTEWCPSGPWAAALHPSNSPLLFCSARCHVIWNVFLVILGQLFLVLSSPCFWCTPQWQGEVKSWNVLGSVQLCSATNKNTAALSASLLFFS